MENNELSTNLAEVGTDVPDNNVGELISRQSVIDMLDETKRIARQNIDGAVLMTFERVFDSLVNITNALPTIQPKRGKWRMINGTGLAMCDCGHMTDRYSVYNFCPNCGADMREVTT